MCENEYGGVWRPPATAVTPSRDGRLCPMLGQRTLRCSANLNNLKAATKVRAPRDVGTVFLRDLRHAGLTHDTLKPLARQLRRRLGAPAAGDGKRAKSFYFRQPECSTNFVP